MENNHLTYFKIENFKKFDSLEVNDIGQFNLIVGDNNVGKTCLLEALLFDEDEGQLISNFHMGLNKRNMDFKPKKIPYEINGKIVFDFEFPQGNYFEVLRQNENKPIHFIYETNSEKKSISISPLSVGGNKQLDKSSELKVPFTNHVILINDNSYNVYNYNENILNFPLISFNDTPSDKATISIYKNLVKEGKKEILINSLNIILPEIKDIDLIEDENTNLNDSFYISLQNVNTLPIPLNYLGDGFKRIFYIVLKTLSLKGKRIMIDEIEIGIHHSKQKDFWVNIIKICKELDVQLFATTHSKECSEAFVEAAKDFEVTIQNELRLIELYEISNKIYSGTISGVENIEYSVRNEPFRGENIYG